MRTWKDKIWQLALVIVGALILSICNTGLNRTANNDNGTSNGGGGTGIALANGFKPSDITGVMICDDYSDGTFTKCYRSTSASGYAASSLTLSQLFSQGWRPVGPLQNMAAYGNGGYTKPNYINDLRESAILFYK